EIIKSLNGQSGKQYYSATHRLIKDRDFLIVGRMESEERRVEKGEKRKLNTKILVKKNQTKINLGDYNLKIKTKLKTPNSILRSPDSITNIDFDKLEFPLEVRKWKNGDVFYPLGMKGKKKLSDFFIDKKISISEKENTWLLTSKNQIVWVIGLRLDDRFKVTDKTKKIYFVERV
ncbi:MAG TPA: tRNA lysidine(34) synthetase TilS, partial [Bacteroidia bacterium]|nr:tRNA lysidine(34) synthetase TilS [Bacteroidia bacterium]